MDKKTAMKLKLQLRLYDSDVCCPKCGERKIDVHYCKKLRWSTYELCWPKFIDIEHLHRYCTRCGFEWLERCLDDELEESDRIQVGGWGFPREVAKQIEEAGDECCERAKEEYR